MIVYHPNYVSVELDYHQQSGQQININKKIRNMRNYVTGAEYPTAHISVRKQRVKQNGKNVYLSDNTEFEIELHNPTSKKVLTKIEIDGCTISQSGLVVRPGERIFLDRLIDIKRKFKYETYNVTKTQENLKAIENNGKVKIYFYRILEPVTYTYPYWWYNTNYYERNVPLIYTNTPPIYTFGTTGIGTSTTTNLTTLGTPTTTTMFSNAAAISSNTIETGQVSHGESSDQNFNKSYDDFSGVSFHTVEWQILPISQRPITTKDLVRKCGGCNVKMKSGWVFCPNCGSEVSENTNKPIEQMSREELIELLTNKK